MNLNIDPSLMQLGKVNRGGMFGNADWGSALAAALAGFAASGGNPAGGAALQMLNQRLSQKREDQQYQRKLDDQWNLWQRQQQFKLDHPEPQQPTQTDRYLAEYLNPATDKTRKAALGQILFPPVMSTVNGMPAIIDRAQMVSGAGGGLGMPAPQGVTFTPVEDGGPTPPASGGFPDWINGY